MSGSPVYIDGRLIGAVLVLDRRVPEGTDRRHHADRRDEGRDAAAAPRAPRAQARLELPVTPRRADRRARARRTRASRRSPIAPADVQVDRPAGGRRRAARRDAAADRHAARDERLRARRPSTSCRRRSATPASRRSSPAAARRRRGRRRRRAAARGRSRSASSLVGGDLEMGATGTVTHIDGDRVYAFGHPFFNLGPTEFPMTRAYVYTMLPSLMSSFKISTMGEVIGTMQQDRATAIAGTLGKGPATDSDDGHARRRAGGAGRARFTLPARERPAVHAAAGLRRALQHARRLRAAVRRGDVHASRARRTFDRHARPRRRGHLHRRQRRCSAPRRPSPGRSRCCSRTTSSRSRSRASTSRSRRPRSRAASPSSASGSTTCGRAPGAPCRSRC